MTLATSLSRQRWAQLLSAGKWSLTALGVLAIIGGGCFVLLGLVTSIWGLVALPGLALVRVQETALFTKSFNALYGERRQAVVQSVVRMVQDGISAGMILLASWLAKTEGLQMQLIWVGLIPTATACLAQGGTILPLPPMTRWSRLFTRGPGPNHFRTMIACLAELWASHWPP
jgi:hypothetical protein